MCGGDAAFCHICFDHSCCALVPFHQTDPSCPGAHTRGYKRIYYPRFIPPKLSCILPQRDIFLTGIIGCDRLKLYLKIYTPKMKSCTRHWSCEVPSSSGDPQLWFRAIILSRQQCQEAKSVVGLRSESINQSIKIYFPSNNRKLQYNKCCST